MSNDTREYSIYLMMIWHRKNMKWKLPLNCIPITSVGLLGPSLFLFIQSFSFPMANPAEPKSTAPAENNVYSVWALPPDDVVPRLKKLMQGLWDEFSGPEFEPHITVVGAISLTPEDALNKFKSASRGLKAYDAKVDRVATGGTLFYQCVFLLINPTPQVFLLISVFSFTILYGFIIMLWFYFFSGGGN